MSQAQPGLAIGVGESRLLKRADTDRLEGLVSKRVTVTIPGPPFGDAKSLDDAKARFKAAWIAFKEKVGAEKLAAAYPAMDHANRPECYRR